MSGFRKFAHKGVVVVYEDKVTLFLFCRDAVICIFVGSHNGVVHYLLPVDIVGILFEHILEGVVSRLVILYVVVEFCRLKTLLV